MFFENLETRRLFSGTSFTPEPPPAPLPPLPVPGTHLPAPTREPYVGDDTDDTPVRQTPTGPFESPRDKITKFRQPGS